MKLRIAQKILKNPRSRGIYSYDQIVEALDRYLKYCRRDDKWAINFLMATALLKSLELGHIRVIDINLPMPIRRVLSHKNVKDNVGKIAIERGPIVYCIESIDNIAESIFNLSLEDHANLKAEYRTDLLEGIVTVSGKINFIPYYSWANRGKSEMTVWVKRGFSN